MRSMKYIVISTTVAGSKSEFMVIFPQELIHQKVARALLASTTIPGINGTVVAAGTIVRGRCSGRSDSLNIESREEVDSGLFFAGGFK